MDGSPDIGVQAMDSGLSAPETSMLDFETVGSAGKEPARGSSLLDFKTGGSAGKEPARGE